MMKQERRPKISAHRAARVYDEMLSVRRFLMSDGSFRKMPDVWEEFSADLEGYKLSTYRAIEGSKADNKAGVITLGGEGATLITSQGLWERAKAGNLLANTIIAHEIAHLALGHHLRSVKHFQPKTTDHGLKNIPENDIELETNYAAVFLQCGVAILDPRIDATTLAKQAFADVYQTKKARLLVLQEAFQKELKRLVQGRRRVTL
ncbi:MAG: hypothetical protein ACOCYW_08280 [Roseicyclus sp.]